MLLVSQPETMPSKKPRLTAVLPTELYEVVEKIATRDERSMSQMAAILIREALTAREIRDRQNTKNS